MNERAWQLPNPEHLRPSEPGHENSPHAVPVAHESHVHVPDSRSQTPRFEHSTSSACAVSADVASSNQALDVGHVLKEQSGPVYPVSHVHNQVEAPLHAPCPLQICTQRVFSGSER